MSQLSRILNEITLIIKRVQSINLNKKYKTLLEWIKDPNPRALTYGEANIFSYSYPIFYSHMCSGPDDIYHGPVFLKSEIAKANGFTSTKEIHDALQLVQQTGYTESIKRIGMNDAIEYINACDIEKCGAIQLSHETQFVLYSNFDPLWKYIHKFLQVRLQKCTDDNIPNECIYHDKEPTEKEFKYQYPLFVYLQ